MISSYIFTWWIMDSSFFVWATAILCGVAASNLPLGRMEQSQEISRRRQKCIVTLRAGIHIHEKSIS